MADALRVLTSRSWSSHDAVTDGDAGTCKCKCQNNDGEETDYGGERQG